MTEVRFLRSDGANPAEMLIGLLDEALEAGRPTALRATDAEHADRLNDWLWMHGDGSFRPHGTRKDGRPERQPIYISAGEAAPETARDLLVIEDAEVPVEEVGRFDRVQVIVDRTNRRTTRALWKALVGAGIEPVLMARNQSGEWATVPARKREG